MKTQTCDFSGWATRNDILCADGRTIRKNAFKENDGQTVPLVWNHQHSEPGNVLGHALLENRDDGVYAYCTLNDTEAGQNVKKLVQHGDVRSLSIYANRLKQTPDGDVLHGTIRELSVVLAGANSGAFIDSVMAHGSDADEGMIIGYDEYITLYHSDDEKKEAEKTDVKDENPESEETVADVFNTLTEKQKTVVYALIAQALSEEKGDIDEEDKVKDNKSNGGDKEMKHNVFDRDERNEEVLTHSQMETIIADTKRYGSLKESFLAHADDYGIEDIDYLFPDARTVTKQPEFIKREMGWVQTVMSGTHHTPFSRIKSIFADITEDEARARGYIKGKLKKEEVFSLLKRTTTPTTVYKKQKLDRDDITDITDFDVIAWLKSEMRMMLDEEIARAILVGDGRLSSSDDKINEQNIRPIWTDEDLYTIKSVVDTTAGTTDAAIASEFIDQAVRAMKDYKGSGSPVCFMTESLLTECLLLKDTNNRRIYKDANEIATAMRVSSIVTVPVMEGLTREADSNVYTLKAIIVNLSDYNVGADKGGAVSMFDDFDIDYNQQKYLIETRCSGALIKPYSAIALETRAAKSAG